MGTSPGADGHPPPRVAVITVSFGSEDVLPSLLRSVPRAAEHSGAVSVVVDNRRDPAVGDVAASFGARYLPLDVNGGYGAGMNAGAADLPEGVDWILVVNPDVELGPGAVDTLVEIGDEDDSIGALGPAIVSPDGSIYPSARAIPSLRSGIGHALFANIWMSNPWTRAYRHDDEPDGLPRDAGWLSGACLLVRRSAFEAINGFDDEYFMYFEDVDLGQRLTGRGYRNTYVPSANAKHSGAHSTRVHSAAMIRAHHISAKRFIDRNYGGPLLFPMRCAIKVGLTVRSLWATRSHPL